MWNEQRVMERKSKVEKTGKAIAAQRRAVTTSSLESRVCLMSPSRQDDLRVSRIKGTAVIDMATYQNRACELS